MRAANGLLLLGCLMVAANGRAMCDVFASGEDPYKGRSKQVAQSHNRGAAEIVNGAAWGWRVQNWKGLIDFQDGRGPVSAWVIGVRQDASDPAAPLAAQIVFEEFGPGALIFRGFSFAKETHQINEYLFPYLIQYGLRHKLGPLHHVIVELADGKELKAGMLYWMNKLGYQLRLTQEGQLVGKSAGAGVEEFTERRAVFTRQPGARLIWPR